MQSLLVRVRLPLSRVERVPYYAGNCRVSGRAAVFESKTAEPGWELRIAQKRIGEAARCACFAFLEEHAGLFEHYKWRPFESTRDFNGRRDSCFGASDASFHVVGDLGHAPDAQLMHVA